MCVLRPEFQIGYTTLLHICFIDIIQFEKPCRVLIKRNFNQL